MSILVVRNPPVPDDRATEALDPDPPRFPGHPNSGHPRPDSAVSETPAEQRRLRRVFWVWVVLFLAAAAIAFAGIPQAPRDPYLDGVSTPLGYTKSLALFLIPIAGFAVWFRRHRAAFAPHARAFWTTAGVIVGVWSLLDIFLANAFFRFPDPAAHLGLFGPGYTAGAGFALDIPIEEFAFYIGGSWFILLCYRFASEVWFAAYNLPDEEFVRRVDRIERVTLLDLRPILWGAAVFAALWLHKEYVSDVPGGFPGYAAFLIGLVVVPTALFHRVVGDFVNIRAFAVTSLALTLVSMLWEVTLALPYGWWNYRHEQMAGIFLVPWSNLPLEAAALWLAAAWSNVTLYEVFRVAFRSDRSLLGLLFPRRGAGATPRSR